MWGATVGNLGAQDPNNAPYVLGVALNLIFGVNINPVNFAISGSTMRGFISGTDGSGSTFEQKLKTTMPMPILYTVTMALMTHSSIIRLRPTAPIYTSLSICAVSTM